MTLTRDTFTEGQHPAWRVAGRLGTVVYRSRNGQLQLEPLGRFVTVPSVVETSEVALAAATGTDDDVYALLADWYEKLPGLAANGDPFTRDLPATGDPEIDRWAVLRGAALTDAMIDAIWYVQEDDLIGGWCITVVDKPPSAGAIEVGSFLGEDTARHIADLHNKLVRAEQHRGAVKATR